MSPATLSRSPASQSIEVPEYDWSKQVRFSDEQVIAGSYTSNSTQTFDSKGQPKDSKSDHTDS